MSAVCSVEGCDALALARSWCNRHYLRWRKYGDPTYTKYRGSNPWVRSLGYGEAPPEGVTPARYKNDQGYIRLRWRVGPAQHVEVYEHRWVAGAKPGEHVHHINGVKDDNRPENLEVLSPQAHRSEHREVDHELVARLYSEGLSTPEVARQVGCAAPTVYRALVAAGVEIRPGWTYHAIEGHDETIKRLHESGVRSRRIARALGLSPSYVDSRVGAMGLVPHRDGRPTNAEIDAARRALEEVGLS
jgi:DNA-binding CsgD family transcriptional regulator